MSRSLAGSYFRRRRAFRRTMRIVIASACGATLGIVAGLATSTSLGLTKFTFFDAVRNPAYDEGVYPSGPYKNPEADYWRTVERMAAQKATESEKKHAEREPTLKKVEPKEAASTRQGGN